MSRIPQPGQHLPCTPEALRVRFPAWKIGFDPRMWIWFAEKRDGTAVHYIAEHTPSELGASLERTEAENAARWVTACSGPDYRQVTP